MNYFRIVIHIVSYRTMQILYGSKSLPFTLFRYTKRDLIVGLKLYHKETSNDQIFLLVHIIINS
jgi:hypothetical protein